jgi:hypothetical protein
MAFAIVLMATPAICTPAKAAGTTTETTMITSHMRLLFWSILRGENYAPEAVSTNVFIKYFSETLCATEWRSQSQQL